jgi:hypothetical protein
MQKLLLIGTPVLIFIYLSYLVFVFTINYLNTHFG